MEPIKEKPTEPTAPPAQSRLVSLVTLVALAAVIYWGLRSDALAFVRIVGVCLAIGLVIFLHELGHFLAAKWAGVKVERFSIGFGPILASFTRGDTQYALSAVPLGGYVKMLGESPQEENTTDPRAFPNKTVGARMIIISAGVIANLILGFVCFLVAYRLGVQYTPAVLGTIKPGGPAWEAGLSAGDKVTQIDGKEIREFMELQQAVALSSPGDGSGLRFRVLRGDQTYETVVQPVAGEFWPEIGVGPSASLVVNPESPVAKGSPASQAKPEFQGGDKIVALAGRSVSTYSELEAVLNRHRGEPIAFTVERQAKPSTNSPPKQVEIEVPPGYFRTLGLKLQMGAVTAVRKGSSAARAGIVPNDVIQTVDGRVVGDDLDPMRLPDYFSERAARRQQVRLEVQREGPELKLIPLTVVPENRPPWTEPPTSENTPLALSAIGVACHIVPKVLAVEPGSAAASVGIQKEDMLVSLTINLPKPPAEKPSGLESIFQWLAGRVASNRDSGELIPLGESDRNWPWAFWLMQTMARDVTVDVGVRRGGHELTLKGLMPQADPRWPIAIRGVGLALIPETRRETSVLAATQLGLDKTWHSVLSIYMQIRMMLHGSISPRAMGGPISIAKVAYQHASQGIGDLALFIAFLSVNLAVLNFLPIPVLDGGHMVFLLIEKIFRRRVTENVMVAANYVGLFLILSLMAWVLYLDIGGR